MAEFFMRRASLKQHAVHRIAYHYEQGHMYKELLAYLRSTQSLGVPLTDRRGYLNVRTQTPSPFPEKHSTETISPLATSLFENARRPRFVA